MVDGPAARHFWQITMNWIPVDAEEREARRSVWTRHWASGAAHSCIGTYGDVYDGEIAAFWNRVLKPVKSGQRILDIATGSGALPRLILSMRPDADVQIDAVDLANIRPEWIARLPASQRARVRFHGGQAAEQLPFDDAQFGLVISQYGLEYSQLDRSVPEMLRVLAPGGRVALLIHHSDSRPVRLAAIEIGHIDWLNSAAGLLSATEAMLEPMARATTPQGRASLTVDANAESMRERFNAAQDALRARAVKRDGADVLFEAQDAVAGVLGIAVRQGATEACSHLATIMSTMADARLRLQELRSHATTPAMLESLCEQLCSAGGTVLHGEVREQGHLMGWFVTADTGPRSAG